MQEDNNYKETTIKEYLFECEMGKDFKCVGCSNIEECYSEAIVESNDEYADSIGFGGYDSAEEFWDNI